MQLREEKRLEEERLREDEKKRYTIPSLNREHIKHICSGRQHDPSVLIFPSPLSDGKI